MLIYYVCIRVLMVRLQSHIFLPFCRCHKLVYACFSYCEHIFDAGIELMGHMKSLVHLDIRGCNISDEVRTVGILCGIRR